MKRRQFIKAGASAGIALGLLPLAPGAGRAADVTVVIKNRVMVPDAVTVKVGQALVIIDQDATSHSIYSETPKMEVEARIAPNGQGSVTFAVAGIATIECAQHATEIAKITVVA
jgi:plastocyanin